MQKKSMVKRSSARHTPSALIEQVDRCHSVSCADIEKQKVKLQAWKDLRNTKHESRWKAGTCAICGEHMEYCITNYHAGLHGYKSAEAMIKAGKVIFD